MAKKICDNCGCEVEPADEHKMMPVSTGRKTEWWCWGCYKKGQYEVGKSEITRYAKRYKIAQEKGKIK